MYRSIFKSQLIFFIFGLLTLLSSCNKIDDSEVWAKSEDYENRISQLESACKGLNTNLSTISEIVSVMQGRVTITEIHSVFEVGGEVGYSITFSNGEKGVVYKNTYSPFQSPAISLGKDGSTYFWIVNGKWILDSNGERIPASSFFPILKVEDNFWYISYDMGGHWEVLEKVNLSVKSGNLWLKDLQDDDTNIYFVFEDQTLIVPKVLAEDVVNYKKLRVLFIGSSFGVNTFIQFPALASSVGIDIYGLNLYTGSCTLEDVADICRKDGSFERGAFYSSEIGQWQQANSRLSSALKTIEWDIIILQRSAPGKKGGCDTWTNEMAKDLDYIIEYIQNTVLGKPKIMFNSTFSRSVGTLGSREKQEQSVTQIMETAKQVQNTFGIEVIPSAVALQNARITKLAMVPTFNSKNYEIPDLTGEGDHLDIGVGSYVLGCLLFEQICGKRYDLSIMNVPYIPTLKDVQNNAGAFPDNNFTQITTSQAHIAKYAAMSAAQNPWNINYELGTMFHAE